VPKFNLSIIISLILQTDSIKAIPTEKIADDEDREDMDIRFIGQQSAGTPEQKVQGK
jgi:hypothetical protein